MKRGVRLLYLRVEQGENYIIIQPVILYIQCRIKWEVRDQKATIWELKKTNNLYLFLNVYIFADKITVHYELLSCRDRSLEEDFFLNLL